MFEIIRYTADKKAIWDDFVARSKNGTFLFYRDYMDYHSDRFQDCSLMVYEKGRLYALLPANDNGQGGWVTHQGLTYGGLLMGDHCRTADVCSLFGSLNGYLNSAGFRHVVYKHIPWIYAHYPSEEDLFALSSVCHASLRSRDVASVVVLGHRLPFSTLRRRCVKKAERQGIRIAESDDLASYWKLLENNLMTRFHAKPVHTVAEMTLLKNRFPEHIRLFVASKDDRLLGGTVLYLNGQTVKTQYISANDEGKQKGALDLLFDTLLNKFESEGMRYFDFGTSNRTDNDELNESLIFQKEGFGGRAVCYDTYEWDV